MRLAMRRTARTDVQDDATLGWLSAVWSGARMECYFQRRSPTFWVVLTLLAALCVWLIGWTGRVPNYVPGSEPLPQSRFIVFFDIVLIPFLGWRTMRRDRQAGTTDLVWTRPVAVSAHVLGKLLGLLLTLALFYAGEAVLVYTITIIQGATGITTAFQSQTGLQAVEQYALALATYMSWIAFGAALYLLVDVLLPLPLLAAVAFPVLFLALCIASYIVLPKWFGLYYWGQSRWQNPFTGTDLFWLGMALIVCSILPFAYSRRTRLAVWTRDCALRSRWLALLGIGLMGWGLAVGNSVPVNPADSGAVQPPNPKAVLAALRNAPAPDRPWIRRASGTLHNLTGVSCPTVGICIAVGDAGTILSSGNDGRSWHRQTSGTDDQLVGVSCSSSSSCVAVGYATTGPVNDIVILTTGSGGSSWQIQHLGDYSVQSAVSCAPGGLCLTVGSATILARNTPGAPWHNQTPGTTEPLEGISCSTSRQCVAVGLPLKEGNGINNTAVLLLNTANGGNSWHSQPAGTTQALSGVSCAKGGRCIAVGAGGTILGSGDGGATWTAQASGTGKDLWAVSCTSSRRCVAIGKGIILLTGNGGVSWHSRSPGIDWALSGVSCPDAEHCVVVGDNGVVLTTRRSPF